MRTNLIRCFLIAFTVTVSAGESLFAQQSITFQITPTRSGSTELRGGFEVPLRSVWSRKFPARVSYPIVADHKVFITVGDNSAGLPYGTQLFALSLATGEPLWSKTIPGDYWWSAATYQTGRLFVINTDGLLRAFNAEDGVELWRRKLKFSFDLPNVGHGLVYVTGNGWIHAIKQATGEIVWKRQTLNGPSAIISSTGVFLTGECSRERLNPLTGDVQWQHYGRSFCTSPELAAPFVKNRLYVRRGLGFGNSFRVIVDVFDAKTGKRIRTLPRNSIWPPVISNDIVYLTSYDVVRARSVANGELLWLFPLTYSPAMAPIIVNGKMILLLATGNLLVLDGATGRQLQMMSLREPLTFPTGVTPGFGAGQGMLLVPAGNQLFALKGASR